MAGILGCCALNICECAACMACNCLCGIVKASLAQAARFGHLLVIITTFTLAIILGQSFGDDINGYYYYTEIDLTSGCESDAHDVCIYRQLIYRASFSLVIVFSLLAVFTACSDNANKSFWVLKFGAAIGGFIGFWWGSNDFFSGYAEFARVVSFIWLLMQGLLFLDMNHDIHDLLTENDDKQPLYLGMSIAAIVLVIVGFVFLFMDYTGCDLGMFFTILTLILGVITTIVSLSDRLAGKGLLTPCLMFAYAVFVCWYALLSSPESGCNPDSDSTGGVQNGSIVVVCVITVAVLMYCIINGSRVLNIFNPNGQGVLQSYSPNTSAELQAVLAPTESTPTTQQPNSATGGAMGSLSTSKENNLRGSQNDNADAAAAAAANDESSGTPHERVFFHVLMVLVSCYGAMILTNWGKTNGAAVGEGSATIGNESMWLKIVSQWIFWIMYLMALRVNCNENENNA